MPDPFPTAHDRPDRRVGHECLHLGDPLAHDAIRHPGKHAL